MAHPNDAAMAVKGVPQTAAPNSCAVVNGRAVNLLCYAALIAVALVIGTTNVSGTGPLFPDAPRYANAGGMVHDWLVSGDLLHPYEFAKKNYCQYPALNVPYHPPAYPALLGAFFVLTGGVSYLSARVFVALCLAGAGTFFFAIVRRMGVGNAGSLACSLVLLTMPEIALWARDTMSEIPALMFLLAGSYLFVAWLRTSRPWQCWAAFGLAELAFLSRVTTAGVLPAWFIYAILTGNFRRLLSPHVVLASVLFLVVNVGWVKFAVSFSKYETTQNVALFRVERLSWDNLSFYPAHLPGLVGWGTLAVAVLGLCYTIRRPTRSPGGLFWCCWFLSYYGFQLALSSNEERYFLSALPSLPGLCAALFGGGVPRWVRRTAPVFVAVALVSNLIHLGQIPHGVVGYDAVAERLNQLERSGNILLACREDQDLIFRYRAQRPSIERTMIRSDRSLAIRVAPYGGLEPEIRAHKTEDVVDLVRRGRVRYLVTCVSAAPEDPGYCQEMALAHKAAVSLPQSFGLVEEFPLHIHFVRGRGTNVRVYLWEYRGELPEGPSEIPVVIPTADLILQADK